MTQEKLESAWFFFSQTFQLKKILLEFYQPTRPFHQFHLKKQPQNWMCLGHFGHSAGSTSRAGHVPDGSGVTWLQPARRMAPEHQQKFAQRTRVYWH